MNEIRGADAPLREFGIKAKRGAGWAHHDWDAPLREFGIKAKPFGGNCVRGV